GVDGRQHDARDRIGKGHGDVRLSRHQRPHGIGETAGEEVILPEIGEDRGNGAAEMPDRVVRNLPIEAEARPPSSPVHAVRRLGINQVLYRYARLPGKRGRALRVYDASVRGEVVRFGNARVDLVAQSVIKAKSRRDLPRVLKVEIVSSAPCRSLADPAPLRKILGRDGNRITEGCPRQKGAECIGERVTGLNIVLSTQRGNSGLRIGRSSAEGVETVRVRVKDRGVTVEAGFKSPLHRMRSMNKGEGLPGLYQ